LGGEGGIVQLSVEFGIIIESFKKKTGGGYMFCLRGGVFLVCRVGGNLYVLSWWGILSQAFPCGGEGGWNPIFVRNERMGLERLNFWLLQRRGKKEVFLALEGFVSGVGGSVFKMPEYSVPLLWARFVGEDFPSWKTRSLVLKIGRGL